MLTKNFTQHLAKDVPNFKRELDFKPASRQAGKIGTLKGLYAP
jgi:hypothetical protein